LAHEITETDNLVLAGKPAWHGLGVVTENAPTPMDAIRLAGLDWRAVVADLYAHIDIDEDIRGGTKREAGEAFRSDRRTRRDDRSRRRDRNKCRHN